MTVQRYRILTLLSCIGMFLVLIAGVLVTNTESGEGCGTDWPLCNGRFVPAYTLPSIVEYSHRAITGIVGLLIGASFIVTWRWKPARNKESLTYAGGALFFTFLQAILGMMAVKWQQSSLVMALHFGISLFAFSCTWLLYSLAKRDTMWDNTDGRTAAGASGMTVKALTVPRTLYRSVVAVLAYCYVVVYLGAYIRHTSSGGGCTGWPLCNGEVVPELGGVTGIAFAHRVAALLLLLLVGLLAWNVRKAAGAKSELTSIASGTLLLVILQVFSGGLLAMTLDNEDVYVFTSLLHTIIIAALFSMLCLLAVRVRQMSRS
ncbi:cytochrome Caa3 oxidase [Cohnella kolymensis]|uniref:Cytochrome Caa3 oxidase n=2 Tax=Cohnella kolymensis TaxID=1590652 RepID=A0ABR5A5C6_9BACL|nr:cytochrome Caa3 oxidase [Cohnella kolymensis]